MCELCEHIETRIQRYCKVAAEQPDPATAERINEVIEALKQRKEAMHAKEMLPAIYRFYALDSVGTFTGSAVRLECPNDSAAIKHTENIKGHFVELWQGDRRIGRFNINP
jgi:hypothetical protein